MTAAEKIACSGHEDVVIIEGDFYDDALVGITDDGRTVYDFDLLVECLMDHDGMGEEEAIEFVEYNILRSLPYLGRKAPIVMYRLED